MEEKEYVIRVSITQEIVYTAVGDQIVDVTLKAKTEDEAVEKFKKDYETLIDENLDPDKWNNKRDDQESYTKEWIDLASDDIEDDIDEVYCKDELEEQSKED